MKLFVLSDLHLEHLKQPWRPEPVDVDVVILAGDIGSHTHGLDWATWAFSDWPSKPRVLYVAGNHEYYEAHLGLLAELQKPVWETNGVTFMERRAVTMGDVRFLGCTLWSAFDLYGSAQIDVAMARARNGINDYWSIYASGGQRLEPRDTQRMHHASVQWLEAELAKPFDGKTVVVTHFAPHRGCVAPEHEGSDLSPYFVTDLSRLMQQYPIDVWCYGHTHTNIGFIAEGGCRVVSNQKGYRNECAGSFRPDFIIEV